MEDFLSQIGINSEVECACGRQFKGDDCFSGEWVGLAGMFFWGDCGAVVVAGERLISNVDFHGGAEGVFIGCNVIAPIFRYYSNEISSIMLFGNLNPPFLD